MILPVVLDKGDILYPLYSADTVCKFHVGIFAEYLYRHLGVYSYQNCLETQIGLGLDLKGGMNVKLMIKSPFQTTILSFVS